MNEDSYQELARLREQVAKQEKMASLGMLTAGIAHEIQNPLNFVINFSKMSGKLLEDLEEILSGAGEGLSDDDREELGEIMGDLKDNIRRICENGERASSIIRNILLYSRGKEDEYLPTDLCRLTKEYVALSYHAMRANHKNFNVTFEEDYDETLPLVNVIPQDFSRAVLNIMNNACYAVFSKSRGATDCCYPHHTDLPPPGRGQRPPGHRGQRHRHPKGYPQASVHPLLHHQACGRGHRTGSVYHQVHHRAEAPREDRSRVRARTVQPFHHHHSTQS